MTTPVTKRSSPILTLTVAVLSVAILAGLIYLTRGEMNKLGQGYQTARELGEKRATGDSVRTLYDETTTAGELIRSYFVGEEDIPMLIERFETLGRQTQTELTLTSLAPEASASGLAISFSTKAPFARQYRLLSLIESLPLKIRFESVSFRASQAGTRAGSDVWTGEFHLTITSYEHSTNEKRK